MINSFEARFQSLDWDKNRRNPDEVENSKKASPLTCVSVLVIVVIGGEEDVVLGGCGLLGCEVFVFDLSELDHCGG